MLKCLLFDLDGLLVDSEPLQFRSYQYALKQFGVSLDLDAWIQWHSVQASTTRWIKDQGLDIEPEEVRAVKKLHYDELVTHELELKPGALDLVEKCSTDFELGVVSSSRRESIEGCLRKFGLDKKFSTFVSGADLKRSKPYPDSYLDALKIMNMAPENAVALEDAFSGAVIIVKSLEDLDPEKIRAAYANSWKETSGLSRL
jgi:HAD superfamily hydrolase (TIGR01509 family)